MERLYPFVLAPKESPAIWGGDALYEKYGKPRGPQPPVGESWECWDENAVANGPFAGRTLADLRGELGADLLGDLDAREPFPVLTKIIDARAALSVQVHPDDAYAQRVEHQRNGKTECWYVLDCVPGAELVLGWTRDVTRAEYEWRVADGTLGDILRRVPVAPGDVYYLPAGTLHAIGAGIEIFEVQQASDLTYRIFDWNRVGADGKPRELHVRKAGDVLDFRATFPGRITSLRYTTPGARHDLLVADPRFGVERVRLTGSETLVETDDLPLAITAQAAHVRIDAGDGSVVLAPWQTCIVPAAAGRATLVPGGEAEAAVLLVRVAPLLGRAALRALDGGASEGSVETFFTSFSAE